MAKQDLKFTIEDVANLILSLKTFEYCTLEPDEEQCKFEICDYYMVNGRCAIGQKFRLTIYEDRVNIFYYPTLNISISFKNESEFHEILSLYLDFKNQAEKYLLDNLRSMIRVTNNHKNPFLGQEVFMDQVRLNHDARPRRAVVNHLDEIIAADIRRNANELNNVAAVPNNGFNEIGIELVDDQNLPV